MRFHFGPFELDEGRFLLLRDGVPVVIQPKALHFLLYLLRSPERAPSRDELLDALWPDVSVSEASLSRAVREARRALGEHASEEGVIRTVRGRGYRIGVPVLRQERTQALEAARHRPRTSIFVGREDALDTLGAALDDALSRFGSVALLTGEPGIGKTRTAEEAASRAAQHGAVVAWGRCREGEGAPVFWPWAQLLRALKEEDLPCTEGEPGVVTAALAPIVPEWTTGTADAAAEVGAAAARHRLHETVLDLVRRCARRAPLVLVFDDLHWADAASLGLLEFVAGELANERVLVVATYRDTEVRRGHRLRATLAELTKNERTHRIVLGGLSRDEVARFVEAYGEARPPSAWVDTVHARTDGNPLFVREIVRLLSRAAGSEGTAVDVTRAVPEGVREAIGKRLDAASERCNTVLLAASVLGREIDVRVLELMLDLSPGEVWPALEEALETRLVEEVAGVGGRFRFSHALIGETLYAELPAPRRLRLHDEAARAIRDLAGPAPGGHSIDVAHHRLQGVPLTNAGVAVEAAREAASWAAGQLAYEDALAWRRRALEVHELLEAPDPRIRCRLQVELALGAHMAGDVVAMQEAAAEVLREARRLGDSFAFAQAAWVLYGLGGPEWMGRTRTEPVAILEEAIEGLGKEPRALRAKLLACLARQLNYESGATSRRLAARAEAASIARESGDASLEFEVVLGLGEGTISSAISTDGPIGELLPTAERAERLARCLGPRERFLARATRATMRLVAGDATGFRKDLASLARLEAALRTHGARHTRSSLLAVEAFLRGAFEQGERHAADALRAARHVHREPFARSAYAAVRMPAVLHQGTAETEWRTAQLESTAEGGFLLARAIAAWAQLGVGNVERARSQLEQILEDPAAFGGGLARTNTLCLTADVVSALEHREAAGVLVAAMRPYASFHAAIGSPAAYCYLGSFATRLGRLMTLLGQLDEAERHFAQAIAWAEQNGADPWLADACCHLARTLATRAKGSDLDRAQQQAARALQLAEALGAPGIARGAAALVAQLRSGLSPASRALERA